MMLSFTAFTLLALAGAAKGSFDPQHLFPVPILKGFTTAPNTTYFTQNDNLTFVDLNDKALGVVKVSSGTNHTVVDAPGEAPDDTLAWEAVYPVGSYNPDHDPRGGFGFYMNGPKGFNFTKADELLFSYAVMFDDDFQWV